jgi:hypothetical protein
LDVNIFWSLGFEVLGFLDLYNFMRDKSVFRTFDDFIFSFVYFSTQPSKKNMGRGLEQRKKAPGSVKNASLNSHPPSWLEKWPAVQDRGASASPPAGCRWGTL